MSRCEDVIMTFAQRDQEADRRRRRGREGRKNERLAGAAAGRKALYGKSESKCYNCNTLSVLPPYNSPICSINIIITQLESSTRASSTTHFSIRSTRHGPQSAASKPGSRKKNLDQGRRVEVTMAWEWPLLGLLGLCDSLSLRLRDPEPRAENTKKKQICVARSLIMAVESDSQRQPGDRRRGGREEARQPNPCCIPVLA